MIAFAKSHNLPLNSASFGHYNCISKSAVCRYDLRFDITVLRLRRCLALSEGDLGEICSICFMPMACAWASKSCYGLIAGNYALP